jgi:hypothetical protein
MQRIQHTNQRIVDNLNNVRREASRHFRNNKKEYLKAKIHELQTNSKVTQSQTSIQASVALRRLSCLGLM